LSQLVTDGNVDRAMDKLKEGELCLILVDQVEEALAHIAAKVANA
jgi:cyanophycin synthetase